MKDLWFEQAKLVKQRNSHISENTELQSLTCSALYELIHRDALYADLKAAVCPVSAFLHYCCTLVCTCLVDGADLSSWLRGNVVACTRIELLVSGGRICLMGAEARRSRI
jgi:hypothetical protein